MWWKLVVGWANLDGSYLGGGARGASRNFSAILMTFLLPQAVLAAVIIVNLKGMMKQFSDICSLWKANRVDLVRSLGAQTRLGPFSARGSFDPCPFSIS